MLPSTTFAPTEAPQALAQLRHEERRFTGTRKCHGRYSERLRSYLPETQVAQATRMAGNRRPTSAGGHAYSTIARNVLGAESGLPSRKPQRTVYPRSVGTSTTTCPPSKARARARARREGGGKTLAGQVLPRMLRDRRQSP